MWLWVMKRPIQILYVVIEVIEVGVVKDILVITDSLDTALQFSKSWHWQYVVGSGPYQESSVDLTKCSKANLIKWKWPHKSYRYDPSPKYSKKLRIHPLTRKIFCFFSSDIFTSPPSLFFFLFQSITFSSHFFSALATKGKIIFQKFLEELPCLIKAQCMFGN